MAIMTLYNPLPTFEYMANKDQPSGYAGLDGSALVKELPASATSVPAASAIPIADVNGVLDSWHSDAGASVQGKVQLAGDLAGTADAPTVAAIHESGGTQLTMRAVADRQLTKRSGTQIIGCSPLDFSSGKFTLIDYRQVGTSPLEIWYTSKIFRDFGTGVFVGNKIIAIPYMESRGGTLDRIGFMTASNSSSLCRLGMYQAIGLGDPYPGKLVVDTGELAIVGSNTVCSCTLNQVLQPGTLYWLVGWTGASFNAIGGQTSNSYYYQYWTTAAGGPIISFGASLAYSGSLPSTFPGGASVDLTNNLPIIAVRYSA